MKEQTFWTQWEVSVSSVAQSGPTLCDPMNRSTPGLPVHHQLPSPNSCPLSRWCHPTILSSVVPFSSCPNPHQHQGLFQWVSSSHQVAKVLEFQLQHQSLQWTPRTDLLQDGLVGSPCSPRDSQDSSPTPQFKSINSLALSFLCSPTLTSNMTTGKTIALTRWIFVGKVMSLLFNILSRLVTTFLPRSKRLFISWLQSTSAVIWSPPKIKPVHHLSIQSFHLPWSDGSGCHDLSFLNVELKANFFTPLFHFQEAL